MSPTRQIRSQYAFLLATKNVFNPTPLETLLELLPALKSWRDRPMDSDGLGDAIVRQRALGIIDDASLDESAEASCLRDGLQKWMNRYGFQQQWIRKIAFLTLSWHAKPGATSGKWCFEPQYDELYAPSARAMPSSDESPWQFRDRRRREDLKFQRDQKALEKKLVTDAGEVRVAGWVAELQAGSATSAEITKRERMDRKTFEKTVYRFKRRADLLPVSTLGEIIPLPAGNTGTNGAS